MSGGFGSVPSFAQDDGSSLSPMMRQFLTGIGAPGVPAATPPGFSGFDPSTPPTGAPTPVANPNAPSLGTAFGIGSAQAAGFSPPGQSAGQGGGYADRVFGAESGGDNFAKNPRSSATGAGQFIDSTWLDQVRKNRSDLAGLPDDQILAMRSDPVLSRQMTEAYGNENGAKLQAAGLPVNDGTKYLAHFAGPQGAIGVLSADPSTPVSQILQPGQMSANPHIAGMNAGQLATWAAGQVGGGGGAGGIGGAAPLRMSPGFAAPAGASMGSTAQAGAFGLTGIVGQGGPVAGQSSPMPEVASLSGQPLSLTGAPAQADYFGGGSSGLSGLQFGQKPQAPKEVKWAKMEAPGRAMSLADARQQFAPSRFFTMLRSHGVRI